MGVLTVLTYTLFIASGVLCLWALVQTIRNRPATIAMLAGAGVVLLLLLVQLVVSIVMWGQSGDTDGVLFFGYLLTAIVLVPLAGVWAFAELFRWGPGVLAAAAATVGIMIERMDQIWL